MAQSYTRQSTFVDGDTITAALFNDEYNQLVNAFTYSSSSSTSTGHRHDGTAGHGGNIHTIGDLDFLNKIVVDSSNNRWGFFVEVSSSAVEQIRIQDGAIVPVTDNDIDLGTSSLEFKDAYFDGTVTTDALVADTADINGGTVDGAVIGGSSAAAGSFTTIAASGAITGSSTIEGTTITATTAFVPDASDGAALGTASLEFSDLYLADGAVVYFGDDQDVSLTHVADTGLLLSSTDQLQFGDSGTYIHQSADGVLDLVSDTEIEINATTIDINGAADISGNLDVGGNLTVTGNATIAGNLTFGDAASDTVAFSADVASNLLPSADNTYDLGASGSEWKDLYVDGTAYIDTLDLNGTAITATAAELNIMDGVTSTTAELNILDGVTSTTAELNILDGVTSTAAELNILDGVTATAAELNILDGVTSTAAELNILDGVTSTAAELNILDGVTATASEINTLDGITAVVGELNALDLGSTAVGTAIASKAVILDSNKDYTGVRNFTITGELDAATLDVSGDVDIDGTLEADAITIDGVTLAETIADTVGAMVSSNTETNITVSYEDADNTLDFVIGTLNQDTTGTADNFTVSANNSSDETVYPVFVDGATGSQGAETDTGLTYNPSTGLLTATGFSGNLTGTLQTAAQTNITSLGTLTALTGGTGDFNWDSNTLVVDSSANRVGILNAAPDVSLDIGSATDAVHMPTGTTAQRPTGAAGYFRYNTTLGKFEGYTDSWGSIGGGAGTNMDTNIYTGDGSTTAFTLSTAPDDENNLMVFVDGVFQAHNAYSVSGTTLTLSAAPASGRVITAYHSTTTVGGSNNTINTMTGDGSDTTLTLSVAPVHENNVQVYFDGVYQSKSNYSISGTTLTFSTAPPTGVLVEAITNTNTSSTTANQLLDADSDTKIQVEESSDEDKIRFDTGGTERVIINSTGMGIGTSSPARELEVTGTGNVYIKVTAPTDNDATGLELANTGATWLIQNDDTSSEALTFDRAGTEVMRIDSNGNVGIGETSPTGTALQIRRSGAAGIVMKETGVAQFYIEQDTDAKIRWTNSNDLIFSGGSDGTTERARIDSSGRVLIGSDTALSVTGGARQFQIEGTSGVTSSMSIIRHSNSSGGSTISLSKSRATADGGVTVVADDDVLGEIRFTGADGSDHDSVSSAIKGEVDGTPGSNDMPGRLTFHTTADGAAAETERMRIASSGFISMGNTVADTLNSSSGYADLAVGDGSGNCGISIYTGTSHGGGIAFADGTSSTAAYRGLIQYSHGDDAYSFWASGTDTLRLSTSALFPNADDSMDLGGSSKRFDDVYATNGTIQTSDKNAKNTIVDSDLGLSFIKELKPVSYKFNNKTRTHYGLIAQDVKETLDSISKSTENFAGYIEAEVEVDENDDPLNGEGAKWKKTGEKTYGLRYQEFIAPLIKAVQEQQTLIETLQAEVKALKGE